MTISRRSFFHQCAVGAISSTSISMGTGGAPFSGGILSSEEGKTTWPIRLDNNENAYGPSQKTMAAMKESLPLANRYPGAACQELAESIANLHKTNVENVILGCGSSEILRMVAAASLGPRKKLVVASPTFDLIAEEAKRLNAEVISVPLTKVYTHNLNAMLAKIDGQTGLVYICNPNNPTGGLTPRRELENFLHSLPPKIPVVIDEAYYDYVVEAVSEPSFLDRPLADDRLIVIRTFSAMHGLAGLRVGYAIAGVQMARKLAAIRLAYGVNIVAAKAAVAALQDSEYVRACRQRNADDHQEFLNVANARMLRVLESHTNFVMLKAERHWQEVVEHFGKNNILLGPLVPSMYGYVRISLGTPDEMKEFWRVWDLMPFRPHKMEM